MEMDKFTIVFFLSLCINLVLAQTTTECDDGSSGLDEHVIEAFIGWPYKLSCQSLHFNIGYYEYSGDYDDLNGSIANCVVKEMSTRSVLHNTTMIYEDEESFKDPFVFEFNQNSSTDYVIEYRIGRYCMYQNITFEINLKQDETLGLNDFPATRGQLFEPPCSVPEYMDKNSLTYKWMFDNTETLPKNAVPQKDGYKLEIQKVSFPNAGNYSCTLQYKGMELKSIIHKVCVGYAVEQRISLTCPEVQPAVIGHNVTIQCSADLGIGKDNSGLAQWTRTENSSNFLCGTYLGEARGDDERYECTMKSSIEGDACYGKDPPDAPPNIYSINLTISNIRRSDLGGITLEFSNKNEHFYRNITLVEDRLKNTQKHAANAVFLVWLILIFTFSIFFFIWLKHHVIWLWRKVFAAYETETHRYTAYLMYYYHQEIRNKSEIYSLVEFLSSFIQSIGGNVYNEAEEARVSQFDVQHIPEVQRNCHSIIIILSPEFVTDQLSTEQTYMTLNVAVETEKKIIFIILPRAKEKINLLEVKTKNTLTYALKSKQNATISWNGGDSFSYSFRHKFENALPKLRPSKKESTSECIATKYSNVSSDLSVLEIKEV